MIHVPSADSAIPFAIHLRSRVQIFTVLAELAESRLSVARHAARSGGPRSHGSDLYKRPALNTNPQHPSASLAQYLYMPGNPVAENVLGTSESISVLLLDETHRLRNQLAQFVGQAKLFLKTGRAGGNIRLKAFLRI